MPPVYRPDIDGLRAVSILSVVAFHASPTRWMGGFIGVDVFFVISGYLISLILLREQTTHGIQFTYFYKRRILRIFPALLLVLLTCLIAGWFILLANEYQQLGKHLSFAGLFLSNFALMAEAGYFDTIANSKPLLHLWSLSIEEQFYLLWPLLLWLASPRKHHQLAVLLLVTFTSFACNIIWLKESHIHVFYTPYTRIWELSAGGCLAWWIFYHHKIHKAAYANAFSLLGLLLIAGGLYWLQPGQGWPGGYALIPVCGSLCIIAAGTQAWLNRTILSHPLAVGLGRISFPWYLWHWPLLSFAYIIEGDIPQRRIRILAVMLSLFLAWVTHQIIEKRFQSAATRNRPKITFFLLVFMLAIVCTGWVTYTQHGFPARAALADIHETIDKLDEDVPTAHAQCLARYGLEGQKMRYCRLSGNDKPRIALVGDSHAAALFSGLSTMLKERGEGLVMMGGYLFTNAILHPEGQREELENYTGGGKATAFIAQEPSIDTVIIAARGPVYITTPHLFYLDEQPEITDKKQVLEIGLRSVLDLMLAHGKKVIFVLEVPTLHFNPESCLMQRPVRFSSQPHDCTLPKSHFDAIHQEYRILVSTILQDYPSVMVFDPAHHLCNDAFCTAKAGGKILYGDDNHLAAAGSDFLAQKLAPLLD